MKYSKDEAIIVINVFERYLGKKIKIKNYSTNDFFHIFEIETILIDDKEKTVIRFKDSLVYDCHNQFNCFPDIADIINQCFF